RPFGSAGALSDDDVVVSVGAATSRADAQQPDLAVGERVQGLADHRGLGTRPSHPADERAVRADQRPVAPPGRGWPAHRDHGREHVLPPRLAEPAGLDQDIVHSVSPASASACQTLSGLSGMSMLRTPACQRPSITAFTYAAGDPTVADSPTPFAPIG